MGNLELFCANFLAMPTKRVKLIGQPVSKNWSLGPKGSSNIVNLLKKMPWPCVCFFCVFFQILMNLFSCCRMATVAQ